MATIEAVWWRVEVCEEGDRSMPADRHKWHTERLQQQLATSRANSQSRARESNEKSLSGSGVMLASVSCDETGNV